MILTYYFNLLNMRVNPRHSEREAETHAVNAGERVTGSIEKIEGFARQARQYAQAKENTGRIRAFVSQKFYKLILKDKNQQASARSFIRNEPQYLPGYIPAEDGDPEAFIIALAIELSKPEYHQ